MSGISQSATLRCLAGGHPKPFVTWWRGDQILPLKNEKVEIGRDYSLKITSIQIIDLGPYVCQAYNSIGKPVSIQVTLKARGPLQARTEEETKYLQYIESEPYEPPQTYRPPTAPPTRPPTLPPRTRAPYYPPPPPVTVYRPSLGELWCTNIGFKSFLTASF